jgi:ATP-dependent exoDNAse (exonuclease V) alpha subunit
MIEYEMLNEQQKEYTDKIVSHLLSAIEESPEDYKERFIALQGKSGAGKSTTTAVIIKQLLEVKRRGRPLDIRVTAPTHKALAVLKDMVKSIGAEGIVPSTIHSYLGLKLQEDYKDGTTYLTRDNSKELERCDILILDEVSMISDNLFEYIIDAVDMGYIRAVLFVGDSAQLKPVEGNPSPLVDVNNSYCEILTLDKIVRQAEGNPLIAMANEIRDYIQDNMDNNTPYPPFQTIKDIVVKYRDNENIIMVESDRDFREHYEANPNAENDSMSLAYTNKKVKNLNKQARDFFKDNAKDYILEGEKLVFNDMFEDGDMILFQNNEVAQVSQANKMYDDSLDIHYWDLLDTQGRYFRVVDRKSIMDYEYEISEIVKKAKKSKGEERTELWKQYFALKKRFANIAYTYAFTIHKCQGSSTKDVYIDLSELEFFAKRADNLDDIYRLCYVGMTRCKERLIFKA